MAEAAPEKKLSAVRVVNKTFGAVGADFPRLFLFTFVLSTVPVFLAYLALSAFAVPLIVPLFNAGGSMPLQITFLSINTVASLTGWAGSGAVMFSVLSRLNGNPAGLARCMLAGARFYLPLLAAAAIFHIGVLLGLVLLIVPGFIAATVMLTAGPVLVAERAGIIDAFQRAEFLSRNNRWIIMVLIVAYALLNAMLGFANNFVSRSILGGGYSIAAVAVSSIVTSVFSTAIQMIRSTGIAAIYHELRAIKDNPMEDKLGQVFD